MERNEPTTAELLSIIGDKEVAIYFANSRLHTALELLKAKDAEIAALKATTKVPKV